MTGKKTAVFGIYKSRVQAEQSVDRLLASGFASDDISVLLPDSQSSKEFAHKKDTKAPEGTTTGVTAGGVVGGTLGLLAGIGALAIPGVGPFIAAGPIVAALAGLGVGSAVEVVAEAAEETAEETPEIAEGTLDEEDCAGAEPEGCESAAGRPVKALGLEPDSTSRLRRLRSVRISAAD